MRPSRILRPRTRAEKQQDPAVRVSGKLVLGQTTYPRPSADALAKALEKVREVYKDDLTKASQSLDKTPLVNELLKAADGVGDDDATRLAMFTVATEIAVQGHDPGLAMQALKASVGRFQPDGPADPKEQVERANTLWKEAEAATADKRLGLQIQAAEWYLRAKPAASGFDKTIIEKRLGELGTAAPQATSASPPTTAPSRPRSRPKKGRMVCPRAYRIERQKDLYCHVSPAKSQDANDRRGCCFLRRRGETNRVESAPRSLATFASR